MFQTCRAVKTTAQATTLIRVIIEDLIVVGIVNKFITIYYNRFVIVLNTKRRYTVTI